MAKIPVYQSQGGAQLPRIRANIDLSPARAILSDTSDKLWQVMETNRKREEEFEVSKIVSDFKINEQNMFKESREQESMGPEYGLGVEYEYMSKFEHAVNLTTSSIKNNSVRSAVSRALINYAPEVNQRVVSFAINASVQRQLSNLEDTMVSTSGLIYNGDDPFSFKMYAAEFEQTLQNSAIPHDVASAASSKARKSYAVASAESLLQSDPGTLVQAVRSGEYNGYLDGNDQARFESRARSALSQNVQTAKYGFEVDVKNAERKALETGEITDIPLASFVQTFGKQGADKYMEYGDSVKANAEVFKFTQELSSLNVMNEREMTAYLDATKPDPSDSDYASRMTVYDKKKRAIETKRAQLASDPVSAVLENPRINDAYKNFANVFDSFAEDEAGFDQKTFEQARTTYANSVIAAQLMMGVSDPKLLTQPEAKVIVSQLAAADTKGLRAQMGMLRLKFGEHIGTVLSQLIDEKLPEDMSFVISTMYDSNGIPNVSSDVLIRGLKASPKDLKTSVGEDVYSGTFDYVQNELQDKFYAFESSGATSEDLAAMVRVITHGALVAAHSGNSPEKNADAIIQDLFDDKYNIKGRLWAPKTLNGSVLDFGALRRQLNTLNSFDVLVGSGKTPVLNSLRYSQEQMEGITKKDIGRYTSWLTKHDGSGVYLGLQTPFGTYIPVYDTSGYEISFSFEELVGMWTKPVKKKDLRIDTMPAPNANPWSGNPAIGVER